MYSILFINYFNFFNNYFIDFFFNLLNICILFFAILIISSRNPMHSIFSLIISFILVSIVLIGFLHCEFLSIIFLIVYVGAISILFLFVVMLLNIKNIDLTDKFFNYFPAGIIVGFILIVEIYLYLF